MWILLCSFFISFSLVLSTFYLRKEKKDITGSTVLITGGSRGLGRQLALLFLSKKCRVVIWDIHKPSLQDVEKELKLSNQEIFVYHCDISSPTNVYETAAQVKKDVGKIDILINNAGVVGGKSLLLSSDETIQRTFSVNSLSHFWTLKAFLPEMIADSKGHIVSIASIMAFCPAASASDYCSSKAAAYATTSCLRNELKRDQVAGVDTLIVCPYMINTGLFYGAEMPVTWGPFGVLTEERVASDVVEAIERQKEVLYIPGFTAYVCPAIHLLPICLLDWLLEFGGINKALDHLNSHARVSI